MAPDANPYLVFYALIRTALEGPRLAPSDAGESGKPRVLPAQIDDAIRSFRESRFLHEILGSEVVEKYAALKQMQADRCPKALGTLIKIPEIQFHHEVTNQHLWNLF